MVSHSDHQYLHHSLLPAIIDFLSQSDEHFYHHLHQKRVSVCLLGCNFKFTGTLIFISAVTGTGALATAIFLGILNIIIKLSSEVLAVYEKNVDGKFPLI